MTHPTTSIAPVEAREYRRLMAHWATGVSLLTSMDSDGRPHGATANAVTSLSLDPALLLACFDLGSQTLAALRASGRFAVTMLAADQEDVSRHFARKGADKFATTEHAIVDGVPILTDALAWVICAVREEIARGDHAIVIGAPLRGAVRDDGEPLLFYRSRYWGLASGPPRAR